ncbi:hypothetical protein [Amorphus sp. 3PC139-8]|uniref:hypothetical protein n=1 Tax=Amorphus sp. 3PC139-8 TaxID=2735676 RepID=UPI00345DE8A1
MRTFSVDIKDQVQNDVADASARQPESETLVDTVFLSTARSGQGTCIHQSRSITKS